MTLADFASQYTTPDTYPSIPLCAGTHLYSTGIFLLRMSLSRRWELDAPGKVSRENQSMLVDNIHYSNYFYNISYRSYCLLLAIEEQNLVNTIILGLGPSTR